MVTVFPLPPLDLLLELLDPQAESSSAPAATAAVAMTARFRGPRLVLIEITLRLLD
jgi:hypothetical protein